MCLLKFEFQFCLSPNRNPASAGCTSPRTKRQGNTGTILSLIIIMFDTIVKYYFSKVVPIFWYHL